jgi:hypothetical protein
MARLLASTAIISASLLLCHAVGAQPLSAEDAAEAPDTPKSVQLLEEIQAIRSEFLGLEKQEHELAGEEKTVIKLQMRDLVLDFIRKVDKLVADVIRQQEEGVKQPIGLKRTRALLLEMDRRIPKFIDKLETTADELRKVRADA